MAALRYHDSSDTGQRDLHNALVATFTSDSRRSIAAKAIYTAIQNSFDTTILLGKIYAFPPDFIVEFPSRFLRNKVLDLQSITGDGFGIRFTPWTIRDSQQPHNNSNAELKASPSIGPYDADVNYDPDEQRLEEHLDWYESNCLGYSGEIVSDEDPNLAYYTVGRRNKARYSDLILSRLLIKD
ncbi:hypothetical protein C2845_PM15G06340 [Panicum miliaceum]|uniref:Uncharacterized protein n=1 Tax=Panicum miliaceum TaxID=4540 RepID=A0A3L6Q9A3_PANMI|nr:hypothetical protein C2845_PM15G06340 [Panicum miliaceum]